MLRKRSLNLAGHATSVALEPEFWAALARMANEDGNYAIEERFLAQLVNGDYGDVTARAAYRLGRICLERGDVETAERLFMMTDNTTDFELKLLSSYSVGMIRAGRGDTEGARQLLNQVAAFSTAKSGTFLANIAAQAKQWLNENDEPSSAVRAEDVPIHFGQAAITVAVTTWMIGVSDVFADAEDDQILGQLFAIFMGRRMERRLRQEELDTAAELTEFVADAEDVVPASTLARFTAVDPGLIDTWYGHILNLAAESNVDLAELSKALISIAAVKSFFSKQVAERDSKP